MVKIFFQHILLTPEAQKAVKSVNFIGYIGVHYRSSRKYPEDALNIKDTSRFISAIRNEINYASSGSKKPILLATDDFDCLESFKGLGLEIVTLFDNTPNHIKDDRSLSIPTFKELWALGTCDSFIISYWSNFSRIACLRTKPKTILVGLDIDFHSGNSVGWYDQMMLKDYDLFTSFNVKPFRDTKLAVWEELLTKHVSNNIIPPEMKNFLIQHDIPFNGDYIKIPSNIKHINIDIGTSYYAPHSQVWLSQNPELLVFGFDAIPESIAEIKRGATLKFKDLPSALETKYLDRFYGIPCALGKESDKEIVFYETTEHSDASSIYVPKFFPHRKRNTVMWRLCDFLRYIDFPVIDYIKIDTQSADYDVITNAGPDLQNRVIWVTIEQQEDQYENVPYNQGDIDRFMISIDFVRVNHPNTKDPTYLNKRLSHLADRCTVYQRT